MSDPSLQPETLQKLLHNCFPEQLPELSGNTPTTSDLIKVVKNLFAKKLKGDDLDDLIESPEIKFADLDCAVNVLADYVDAMSVLDLRELVTYKVFACEKGDSCVNRPPEIVSNNEYMDKCLECPFYHHEKDKRRLFLTFLENDDFTYKANYLKTGESPSEIEACSKNFFESLFHPIFYKLFPCKRKYCEGSYFCPFRHSDKEKNTWDDRFMKLTNKQRDLFLKEKPFLMPFFNNGLSSLPEEIQSKASGSPFFEGKGA